MKNYYWYVTGGGKPRRPTGFLRDQQREANDYLQEIIAGMNSEGVADDVPVMSLVRVYINERLEGRPGGERAKYAINPLAKFFKQMTVSDLTPQVSRRYATKREGMGCKAATSRRELSIVRAALNHARDEGRLKVVPPIPLPEVEETDATFITASQAAKVVRHFRNSNRAQHVLAFVMIALYTGARKTAILTLRFEPHEGGGHVDLDAGRINFQPANYKRTKKRRANVRIPPRLLRTLKGCRATTQSGWVIECGGKRVLDIKSAWDGMRRATGVQCRVHDLDHTCITWMLQAGVPMFLVGGHTGRSEDVINSTYGHHSIELTGETMLAMSRRFRYNLPRGYAR